MPDETLIAMQLSLMGRVVKSYRFGKPMITVGRDPESDVIIDNPGVSREHLRLERGSDGEYEVVDMGSANGTFLNDLPVKCKIPLRSGDCVRFGKYTLTVAYERDRRSETTTEPSMSMPPVNEGHTVVLSKTELNRLLNQQARAESAPPPTPPPAAIKAHASPEIVNAMNKSTPAVKKSGNSFVSAFAGFIVGAATSAAVMWVVLR
jgi:pSer/pThr/pTyr-binding forkhead associated (FHA) protein